MWPDLAGADSSTDSGGEGEGLFFGLDLREERDIAVAGTDADASLPAWWMDLHEDAAEEKAAQGEALLAAMNQAKADAIEEEREARAAIDEAEAIREAREEAIENWSPYAFLGDVGEEAMLEAQADAQAEHDAWIAAGGPETLAEYIDLWWQSHNDAREENSPCGELFDIDWSNADPDCLPVSGGYMGPTGLETVRYNEQALEALCQTPCINPTTLDTSPPGIDLQITGMSLPPTSDDQDWQALVECAWGVLLANQDLIDFVVCALTGRTDAGDCIARKINNQEPEIFLSENDVGDAIAQAFPEPGGLMSGGMAGAAAAGFVGAVLLNLPGFVIGVVIGAVIGTGVDAAVGPTQISIYVNEYDAQLLLADWRAGGTTAECACLSMAALLLHEISHLCAHDLIDSAIERECPYADLIQNSFASLLEQRYASSGCGNLGTWYAPAS